MTTINFKNYADKTIDFEHNGDQYCVHMLTLRPRLNVGQKAAMVFLNASKGSIQDDALYDIARTLLGGATVNGVDLSSQANFDAHFDEKIGDLLLVSTKVLGESAPDLKNQIAAMLEKVQTLSA